jgi:hypothetical protein
MATKHLTWIRALSLVKRELRSPGLWALTVLFMGYGLWSTWPGSPGAPAVGDSHRLALGPLSFSSWAGILVAVMSVIVPVWIIERVPLDQKARWFDPLFVAGWKREAYLVSQFGVVVGFGTAVFFSTVLTATVTSVFTGVAMPRDTLAKVTVAIPTFLASGAGGLLLATVFRERVLALSAGIMGIALPMAVSAYFVFKLDQLPSDPLRLALSLHLPPLGQDPAPAWLLYKLVYATVALWLSLFLGERLIGRRP